MSYRGGRYLKNRKGQWTFAFVACAAVGISITMAVAYNGLGHVYKIHTSTAADAASLNGMMWMNGVYREASYIMRKTWDVTAMIEPLFEIPFCPGAEDYAQALWDSVTTVNEFFMQTSIAAMEQGVCMARANSVAFAANNLNIKNLSTDPLSAMDALCMGEEEKAMLEGTGTRNHVYHVAILGDPLIPAITMEPVPMPDYWVFRPQELAMAITSPYTCQEGFGYDGAGMVAMIPDSVASLNQLALGGNGKNYEIVWNEVLPQLAGLFTPEGDGDGDGGDDGGGDGDGGSSGGGGVDTCGIPVCGAMLPGTPGAPAMGRPLMFGDVASSQFGVGVSHEVGDFNIGSTSVSYLPGFSCNLADLAIAQNPFQGCVEQFPIADVLSGS